VDWALGVAASLECGDLRNCAVLPLSDGLRTRRFQIVNVSIIVANFAVWLFYEIPHLRQAVFHASFYPCTVNHTCYGPESWGSAKKSASFASWIGTGRRRRRRRRRRSG
jgi:hypothetical protein